MVYLIPILLTLLGISNFDFKNRRKTFYWYFLWITIWISLVLIMGLRYRVGGDTNNYMGDYIWRPELSEWEFNIFDKYQPSYSLLCSIAKSFSEDFYWFQLLHASIFNSLLFLFVIKACRYPFSALFAIFISSYLYFSTEILREALAVLVFVININSYIKKQWFKYYIGALLAMSFHISACFLLVLPFVRTLSFNKNLYLFFIAWVVFLFVSKPVLEILSNITLIEGKISNYIDEGSRGLLADMLNLCRYFLFPIVFIIIVKRCAHYKLKYENLLIILSLLGLASYFSPIIFGRLINYFILFLCVSVSDFAVYALRSKRYILTQYSLIISLTFLLLIGSNNIMYGKYTRWIPYSSIFNPIDYNRDNYGTK